MSILEAFVISEGSQGVPFLLEQLAATGAGTTDYRAVSAHVLSARGSAGDDARRLAVYLKDRSLNVQEVAAFSLAHFAGPEVAQEFTEWARQRARKWQDGRGIEVPALLLYAARNHLLGDALAALGGAEIVNSAFVVQMGDEERTETHLRLDSSVESVGQLTAWLAEHNLTWRPQEAEVRALCSRLLGSASSVCQQE